VPKRIVGLRTEQERSNLNLPEGPRTISRQLRIIRFPGPSRNDPFGSRPEAGAHKIAPILLHQTCCAETR
jgi:hypothetical protein